MNAAPAYPAEFLAAIAYTLPDEGGYVDDPYDNGGPTKWGISKRVYPNLDIEHLSRDQAIAIYYRDYWLNWGFGRLAPAISAKVFDLAIVMGEREATKCLQRACRACGRPLLEDGIIGAVTGAATIEISSAVASGALSPLLAALRSEAAGFFIAAAAIELPNHDQEFLPGWLNRAYR